MSEYDLVEGHLREEIERLREQCAELDALRHTACDQRDDYKAEVAQQHALIKGLLIDDADAQIKRLRELVALREKQLDTHISVIWKKGAEIERLRHQLIIEQEKVGERDSEIKRLRQMVAAVKEVVDDE